MTRGEKVIAFIEEYCRAPEGAHVGKKLALEEFQKKFILDVYDNNAKTSLGILSIARKNGKTALIGGILLAHICGPEARLNTQIISGALSRDQAALVFRLAYKMITLDQRLADVTKVIPSKKTILGLARNVEFEALSAEAKTKHGLSPVLAILDEIGQVRGPQSDFVDAITTAQGAHDDPLLLVISTQAPNDGDLLSIWIDDAQQSKDPHIVCHVYSADKDAELKDPSAWRAANPALGHFRSLADVEKQAEKAVRMPSFEATFRNLILNQRVEMSSPFITRSVWAANNSEPDLSAFRDSPCYVGLDLSARTDLTSMAIVAQKDGGWHARVLFWSPEKTLIDRAKRDRAPYDVWAKQGWIRLVSGASIDYEELAQDIVEELSEVNLRAIAFDRWRFDILKKELTDLNIELPLVPFGQGFKDMSPAIESLEMLLLNKKMSVGNNPVLTMCMANARTEQDPAGNRKLNKLRSTGRIDGAVALTMAIGLAHSHAFVDEDFDGFLSSALGA